MECKECKGLGVVEDPQHGHSTTCPACRGRGKEPPSLSKYACGLQLEDDDEG